MMDYRRPSKHGSRMDKGNSDPAYMSFAPPPLVANGILAETPPNMWWDEERIEATVTRQYVCSQLRPDEQVRLDLPLEFGDGLTDDTYMEWIEMKAKRIFLILVDLGVPDQIFGVIDDSWDDDDLPVPLDQVERLQLTYDKDEKLERKFFHRQFIYLLRNIQKGDHLYYDEEEVVPLELAERKAVPQVAGLTQSNIDKVHLPGRPDDVFIRRKVPLGVVPGRMPQEELLSGVQAMKAVEHNHLMSIWASYIQHDCGYLLLTPANDSNLKRVLEVMPQSMKILSKLDRRLLLLNWIHCLADAVDFLHGLGQSHRNIKPSAVLIDQDNHIFLGDFGVFSVGGLVGEKRGFDKETYDYAAPENAQLPPTGTPALVPMASTLPRPGTGRRATATSTTTSTFSSMFSNDNSIMSPTWSTSTSPPRNSPPRNSPPKRQSLSKHDPQKADIFALGAIILEILTLFMKKESKKFAAHRSAKNKTPGRGGGLPDSSFHKNLAQVESWTSGLAKDASKKEDQFFRGVERILILTEKMLGSHPDERPTASYVKERIHTILVDFCAMGHQGTTPEGETMPSRGRIHCDARQIDDSKFHFGFEDLRIASQRAAAEACASVNPFSTEARVVGVNGGLVHGVERNLGPPLRAQSVASGFSSNSISVGRVRSQDTDVMSTVTRSSKSSEGKSKSGSGSMAGSNGMGQSKVKPKAKAWKAPVYAEFSFG